MLKKQRRQRKLPEQRMRQNSRSNIGMKLAALPICQDHQSFVLQLFAASSVLI